jgi:hypothetical protein
VGERRKWGAGAQVIAAGGGRRIKFQQICFRLGLCADQRMSHGLMADVYFAHRYLNGYIIATVQMVCTAPIFLSCLIFLANDQNSVPSDRCTDICVP